MSRRVGLLVLVVVLILAGATVALVVTAKSPLQDRRDAVDGRWVPLRAPLTARYDALGRVAAGLDGAGAGERTYAVDLSDRLDEWSRLTKSGSPDAGSEATVANELEGLATRVRTNVFASGRLSRDPGLADAFTAFDAALVPPPAVVAYNRAVHRYENTRQQTTKRLPARILGFDARPTLVIGPPAGSAGA
jgi:hypothetical protein